MNISELYETMDYGEAFEDPTPALDWLKGHEHFGLFINGAWVKGNQHFPSHNPATGEKLGLIAQGEASHIDAALQAARQAQPAWAKDHKARARALYALARHIQKHARCLAILETLDNGKPIRESRDADIPLAIRHFYHHAGWAMLEGEFEGLEPHGVAAQIIPWNFPFLMLAWKLAPALAAGNTVILKPAEQTSLSALFFAQICQEIGLPKGVVNIITGDGQTGAALTEADIDKIAFTGSTEVGRIMERQAASRAIPLTLELGGKSPFIVFEDADLDAAVEGVVNAIWYNQGEVCCAGARLLVQESIADLLFERIRIRMDKLRIGNPLDKSIDMGALVDQTQLDRVTRLVSEGVKEGGALYQNTDIPDQGCYFPPTFITDLEPADPLMQEEIFGPVLTTLRFRTETDAINLANNTRFGLAASLWSENLDQCLSVAPEIDAGVIWINSHNLFDAAAEFGGVKESGFGREGGKNGMFEYLRPIAKPAKIKPLDITKAPTPEPIDITRKFMIGGKQTRPDSGLSTAICTKDGSLVDYVGEGNRKDIRNAVEAARHSSWQHASAHNRAQVLYYFGENLERRRAEFLQTLSPIMNKSAAKSEIETAIDAAFEFAAWADKNKGQIGDVPSRAVALLMNEPTGTIGIIAHPDEPLAAPLRASLAALSMGNRIVLCAPQNYPLAALDLGLVAENSDMPAGAFNVLSGDAKVLGKTLLEHAGVEAVWDFYDLGALRAQAASNIKRVLMGDAKTLPASWLLKAATASKTIWLPYGALY